MLTVQESAETLSGQAVFAYGGLGALIALGIVFAFPTAILMVKDQFPFTITTVRVIGVLFVLGFCFVMGGLSASVGDATAWKEALAYGSAWESVLGGGALTVRAALPTPP